MTYAEFYLVLLHAEARRDDKTLPDGVRKRSAETVSLCKIRMAKEGLSREDLKKLAEGASA